MAGFSRPGGNGPCPACSRRFGCGWPRAIASTLLRHLPAPGVSLERPGSRARPGNERFNLWNSSEFPWDSEAAPKGPGRGAAFPSRPRRGGRGGLRLEGYASPHLRLRLFPLRPAARCSCRLPSASGSLLTHRFHVSVRVCCHFYEASWAEIFLDRGDQETTAHWANLAYSLPVFVWLAS